MITITERSVMMLLYLTNITSHARIGMCFGCCIRGRRPLPLPPISCVIIIQYDRDTTRITTISYYHCYRYYCRYCYHYCYYYYCYHNNIMCYIILFSIIIIVIITTVVILTATAVWCVVRCRCRPPPPQRNVRLAHRSDVRCTVGHSALTATATRGRRCVRPHGGARHGRAVDK